jgi:FkbM family methyltransferase
MKSAFKTLAYIASHPLASRRPISAIYRYAWWQVGCRLRKEIEYDWVAGSKFLVRRGMTGATGNIYCGLHEFADMGFLLHFLQPDDLFVDVGANIGSYTILATSVCHARAIAVEPDPHTMDSLRRNLAINGQNTRVDTIEAALGATAGRIRFTAGRDTINRVANSNEQATREVDLRTLDEVVQDRNPQMIKMDVEGYEAAVVAGASKTLAKNSLLAVVTESSDQTVRAPLQALGFRQYYYDPFTRSLLSQPTSVGEHSPNSLFIREIEQVKDRVAVAPMRMISGIRI